MQRIRGNEYRTTVVCVDEYEHSIPVGRLYNPYFCEGEKFRSMMEFFRRMEDMLDSMQLPQSFTAGRSFRAPPALTEEEPPGAETQVGKLATFAVRVIFRQNASWQGSVVWLEEGREESFRSVLELVLLMDSALGGTPQQVIPQATTSHGA